MIEAVWSLDSLSPSAPFPRSYPILETRRSHVSRYIDWLEHQSGDEVVAIEGRCE